MEKQIYEEERKDKNFNAIGNIIFNIVKENEENGTTNAETINYVIDLLRRQLSWWVVYFMKIMKKDKEEVSTYINGLAEAFENETISIVNHSYLPDEYYIEKKE